jgi:hypothetical protein
MSKEEILYWLNVIVQLVQQDRIRADEIVGKTLIELVELARTEWDRAQGEVDKLNVV